VADDGFLSRWSRRKAEVARGVAVPPAEPAVEPSPAPVKPPAAPPGDALPAARAAEPGNAEPAQPPLPTLADVAALTQDSSYAPFMARGVSPEVKNAAMKKLFTDPHFNVMDGLDIYIDDYGIPDPIPDAMLRLMNQSKSLGLFDHEEVEEAAPEPFAVLPAATPLDAAPLAETPPDDHEDADLRLQQDDAVERPGAEPGARDGAGR